jgi:hypothetical protein
MPKADEVALRETERLRDEVTRRVGEWETERNGSGHRAQGMEHGVKGFVNIVEGKKLKS